MAETPLGEMPYHEQDFPYQRTLDKLVTRREYLHLLTLTSLGLFLGTVGVALGALRGRRRDFPAQRVASVGEVAEGAALNFSYPTADDPAILVHLPGGRFVAYGQRCTHLACAVFWEPRAGVLACPCHEGFFDVQTGLVIAGPPPRPLPRIELRSEGGVLYAVGVQG